jgi:uncharacterized membrane protein YagU involved in acid resistance
MMRRSFIMKDRFSIGFTSGIIGGLVPFIFNFSSRALGFTTLLWSDFMGSIMLGRMPEGTLERVFFVVVEFMFLGVLGAIFALILPYISSKRHLFKGALFGVTVWFILFSLPHLLQLPGFDATPLKTAVSNIISASLWGLSLAYILKRLDNKVSH